jgi:hypothetical protein
MLGKEDCGIDDLEIHHVSRSPKTPAYDLERLSVVVIDQIGDVFKDECSGLVEPQDTKDLEEKLPTCICKSTL